MLDVNERFVDNETDRHGNRILNLTDISNETDKTEDFKCIYLNY
jgi:hypothetical protein